MSEPQWPGQPDQPGPEPGQQPAAQAPQPGVPYGAPQPGQQPPTQAPQPGQSYGAPQPGQPYGPPPGQFGPGGYLPPGGPPGSKSKAPWIIGGIAVLVVVAVVAGVLVWVLSGGSSEKPPPKASAKELLLDKADFPKLNPAGKFDVSTGKDDDSDVTVSPSECSDLVGKDDRTAETAKAEMDNSDAVSGDEDSEPSRDYIVRVTKDVEDSDKFESILDKCKEVTLETGEVTFDGTIERLNVEGTKVPVKAAVARFTATVDEEEGVEVDVALQVLHGTVRGTTVEVTYNRMSLNGDKISADSADSDAIELFNKQVDKINKAD